MVIVLAKNTCTVLYITVSGSGERNGGEEEGRRREILIFCIDSISLTMLPLVGSRYLMVANLASPSL